MKNVSMYFAQVGREVWEVLRHAGMVAYLLATPLLAVLRILQRFVQRVVKEMYRSRTPIPPWKRTTPAPSRLIDVVVVVLVLGLGIFFVI